MITVTFIRHGESEDNLRPIWAGWKDAPLSELGTKQATAVGQSLSSTPISIIYASPLKRAYSTALAVQQHQAIHPKLIPDPNLREQHFGAAEGNIWILEHPSIDAAVASSNHDQELGDVVNALAAQGIYPVIPSRVHKFPEGESMDDLAGRAQRALKDCIFPHLVEQVFGGAAAPDVIHVVLVSHGLCISELVSALVRLDPYADQTKSYRGLLNTAWTRVVVSVRDGYTGPFDVSNPPPLEVKVTHFNTKEHLESLNAAKPANDDAARKFFAGETSTSN